MFDLDTILKAISLVGAATDAGKTLYNEFRPLLDAPDQDALKAQYAKAIEASDADHAELQQEIKA